MSAIRILPDQLANRIAAGEVIERPVAVVKELVDNSVDAGATQIRVHFSQGGKAMIRVEDNGSGMSADDALLSIERHATSKIQSSDDLFNIRTLGFRGEALPSIASVSRFLLQSRDALSEAGTEILIHGGRMIHRKEVGMPVGTRVEVTHLFSSIPARRKFLKTDNTEASHIVGWMRLIAVAHPSVRFRLVSGQKTVFSIPEGQELLERIEALWGKPVANQLIPFSCHGGGLHGVGFIGKAGVARPSRSEMVTIVNGRPVECRTLGYAFTEAYHTHIPKGRYPLVFVHFSVDPSLIDVNIHPSKKEIKFKQESLVRGAVIRAVWDTLKTGHSAIFQIPSSDVYLAKPPSEGVSGHSQRSPETPSKSGKECVKTEHEAMAIDAVRVATSQHAAERESHVSVDNQNSGKRASMIEREWRFIGSYSRAFSVFERPGSLCLVHNTRALRRILFERFLQELEERGSVQQLEIIPCAFELDSLQASVLKRWMPRLEESLIRVVEFGRNFFRIEAVPGFLEPTQIRDFIQDVIAASPDQDLPGARELRNQMALLGCDHAAKKLELPLSREASMRMLGDLLQCGQPTVDPHGRPVIHDLPDRIFQSSD